MDDATRTELEAAAFRALRHHLLEDAAGCAEHRPDEPRRVLPQLPGPLVPGGGGRARHRDDKEEAREIVYGMPYADWVAAHQTEADDAKKAAFDKAFAENVGKR